MYDFVTCVRYDFAVPENGPYAWFLASLLGVIGSARVGARQRLSKMSGFVREAQMLVVCQLRAEGLRDAVQLIEFVFEVSGVYRQKPARFDDVAVVVQHAPSLSSGDLLVRGPGPRSRFVRVRREHNVPPFL